MLANLLEDLLYLVCESKPESRSLFIFYVFFMGGEERDEVMCSALTIIIISRSLR